MVKKTAHLGLGPELSDEVGRLKAELQDCEDDFHALKEMFDKMRADRDHWRSIVEDYLAFEGLIIARCCRDWPAVPPGQGGTCKQCGKKPQIIWEEYIGPYHGE